MLTECHIEFLGRIVNANGEPITGNYTAIERSPKCNYTEFRQANKQVAKTEQSLKKATANDEVTSSRFELDILLYSDAWYACQETVNSLLRSNQGVRTV